MFSYSIENEQFFGQLLRIRTLLSYVQASCSLACPLKKHFAGYQHGLPNSTSFFVLIQDQIFEQIYVDFTPPTLLMSDRSNLPLVLKFLVR